MKFVLPIVWDSHYRSYIEVLSTYTYVHTYLARFMEKFMSYFAPASLPPETVHGADFVFLLVLMMNIPLPKHV